MSDETPEPTLREWLVGQLQPVLPDGWGIAPGMGMPETLSKTVTVAFKHLKITPLPESPQGHLDNSVTITIANPHLNQDTAEEKLDDQVLELILALQLVPGLHFIDATKVQVSEQYLGWDLSCSIISKKKEAPSA